MKKPVGRLLYPNTGWYFAAMLLFTAAAAAGGQSQHRHTGAAIYLKLHLAVQHTAPLFVIGTLHHNQSSTPFLS